jgi:hypothetical protein
MNFEMTDTRVQQHVNEIRYQASQCRGHASDRSRPRWGTRPSGQPGTALRHRVGITLIEAGLHLLATDGPQAGA